MRPEEYIFYFQEEPAKNRKQPKEFWKSLKSLCLSSEKCKQIKNFS